MSSESRRRATRRRTVGAIAAAIALSVAVVIAIAIAIVRPSPAPVPEIESVRALPHAVPPPSTVVLGRATFPHDRRVRIVDAIDRLLQHPSDLCAELARNAWHRWQDDRISDGRGTVLCPGFRFGYMGRATGETYLCERAFESDTELVATLAHEERHHRNPEDSHRRARDWDMMCPVEPT